MGPWAEKYDVALAMYKFFTLETLITDYDEIFYSKVVTQKVMVLFRKFLFSICISL